MVAAYSESLAKKRNAIQEAQQQSEIAAQAMTILPSNPAYICHLIKESAMMRCPGCFCSIGNPTDEEAKQCRHMMCERCREHFCGICFQRGENAEQVYQHIQQEHDHMYRNRNTLESLMKIQCLYNTAMSLQTIKSTNYTNLRHLIDSDEMIAQCLKDHGIDKSELIRILSLSPSFIMLQFNKMFQSIESAPDVNEVEDRKHEHDSLIMKSSFIESIVDIICLIASLCCIYLIVSLPPSGCPKIVQAILLAGSGLVGNYGLFTLIKTGVKKLEIYFSTNGAYA